MMMQLFVLADQQYLSSPFIFFPTKMLHVQVGTQSAELYYHNYGITKNDDLPETKFTHPPPPKND